MGDVNVKVVIRFRPINALEKEGDAASRPGKPGMSVDFPPASHSGGSCTRVKVMQGGKLKNAFAFDNVLQATASQEEVFDATAKATVQDVVNGYNGTIFAYGQTGSGKSFSMFGLGVSSQRGIIPRACEFIFDHIGNQVPKDTEVTVKCSFLEIYKETIRDLLKPNNTNLRVRETPSRGVWVDNLTEQRVTNHKEVIELLNCGEKFRSVSATQMNAGSSRSHSLFVLTLKQKGQDGSSKTGKLNLVDLAGNEKVKKTRAEGDTLEEAKKINQSLSALGNCINALTKADRGHVPYRDSKLTFLLQESLGGNSKTTMIVCCSSHRSNMEETLSSLQFAQRAKSIKNTVKINRQRSVEELNRIIAELTKELDLLRPYCRTLEQEILKLNPKFDIASAKKVLVQTYPTAPPLETLPTPVQSITDFISSPASYEEDDSSDMSYDNIDQEESSTEGLQKSREAHTREYTEEIATDNLNYITTTPSITRLVGTTSNISGHDAELPSLESHPTDQILASLSSSSSTTTTTTTTITTPMDTAMPTATALGTATSTDLAVQSATNPAASNANTDGTGPHHMHKRIAFCTLSDIDKYKEQLYAENLVLCDKHNLFSHRISDYRGTDFLPMLNTVAKCKPNACPIGNSALATLYIRMIEAARAGNTVRFRAIFCYLANVCPHCNLIYEDKGNAVDGQDDNASQLARYFDDPPCNCVKIYLVSIYYLITSKCIEPLNTKSVKFTSMLLCDISRVRRCCLWDAPNSDCVPESQVFLLEDMAARIALQDSFEKAIKSSRLKANQLCHQPNERFFSDVSQHIEKRYRLYGFIPGVTISAGEHDEQADLLFPTHPKCDAVSFTQRALELRTVITSEVAGFLDPNSPLENIIEKHCNSPEERLEAARTGKLLSVKPSLGALLVFDVRRSLQDVDPKNGKAEGFPNVTGFTEANKTWHRYGLIMHAADFVVHRIMRNQSISVIYQGTGEPIAFKVDIVMLYACASSRRNSGQHARAKRDHMPSETTRTMAEVSSSSSLVILSDEEAEEDTELRSKGEAPATVPQRLSSVTKAGAKRSQKTKLLATSDDNNNNNSVTNNTNKDLQESDGNNEEQGERRKRRRRRNN